MTWARISAAADGSTSAEADADIIHGLSINDGDVLVFGINSNNDDATITDDTATGAEMIWVVQNRSDMTSQTCTYSVGWKVADSEPGTYEFSHGGAARWSVTVSQYRWTGDGAPEFDAGPQHDFEASNTTIAPFTGITVADDSIAHVFVGDDHLGGPGGGMTNGYVLGAGSGGQTSGMGYKIFNGATGGATGDAEFSNMSNSARSFTEHFSIKNGAAAAALIPPALLHSFAVTRASNY